MSTSGPIAPINHNRNQPIIDEISSFVDNMSTDEAKTALLFQRLSGISYEYKSPKDGERDRPEINIKDWNLHPQSSGYDPAAKYMIEQLAAQSGIDIVYAESSSHGGKKHKKRTSKKGPSRKNKRKNMKNKSRRHRK